MASPCWIYFPICRIPRIADNGENIFKRVDNDYGVGYWLLIDLPRYGPASRRFVSGK